MTISELELFDVTGDGLLVLKTQVDEPTDDLRYAWYVKENGTSIYKGSYQSNPYVAVQLPRRGKYAVTAFVRNGAGEKISMEAVFRATRKTSPLLENDEESSLDMITPIVERISGSFWRFHAVGEAPEGARFAWYVYRDGEETPVVRSVYAEEPTYVHKFEAAGIYSVKLFVMAGNAKSSMVTENFVVKV